MSNIFYFVGLLGLLVNQIYCDCQSYISSQDCNTALGCEYVDYCQTLECSKFSLEECDHPCELTQLNCFTASPCNLVVDKTACSLRDDCILVGDLCQDAPDCSTLNEIDCIRSDCHWSGSCIESNTCDTISNQNFCEVRLDCIWKPRECVMKQELPECSTLDVNQSECDKTQYCVWNNTSQKCDQWDCTGQKDVFYKTCNPSLKCLQGGSCQVSTSCASHTKEDCPKDKCEYIDQCTSILSTQQKINNLDCNCVAYNKEENKDVARFEKCRGKKMCIQRTSCDTVLSEEECQTYQNLCQWNDLTCDDKIPCSSFDTKEKCSRADCKWGNQNSKVEGDSCEFIDCKLFDEKGCLEIKHCLFNGSLCQFNKGCQDIKDEQVCKSRSDCSIKPAYCSGIICSRLTSQKSCEKQYTCRWLRDYEPQCKDGNCYDFDEDECSNRPVPCKWGQWPQVCDSGASIELVSRLIIIAWLVLIGFERI